MNVNVVNWSAYLKFTMYTITPMRGGFDVAFCRVLWVTLVVVALSFTVILTSVFVDIDGMIKQSLQPAKQQPLPEFKNEKPVAFEDFQNLPSIEDDDIDDTDSGFRTKRSLESNNKLIYQIKSPKMKKILTDHLATLLEELDKEETLHDNRKDDSIKSENIVQEIISADDGDKEKGKENDNSKTYMENNNIFHEALHNILLQGIIDHTDLNDVYKKLHLLVKTLEIHKENESEEIKEKNFKDSSRELMKIIAQESYNEEAKLFEELLKCQKLHKQLQWENMERNEENNETAEDSPILIKTVIEINNDQMKNNVTNSRKNIKGLIKLLFNGQPIRIKDMGENKSVQETIQETHSNVVVKNTQPENFKTDLDIERRNERNSDLNYAIADYLRNHKMKLQNDYNILSKKRFETKRLKRQIKIHYKDSGTTTEKSKVLNSPHKKHEDELYVEIETHFDGKGVKGERKKKLVRSLIDKIQKAINSNIEDSGNDNKEKPVQIKKRMQNPIDHDNKIPDTTLPPLEPIIEHRFLNPISKTANIIQPVTSVLDKHGETWKKNYNGPGFLSVSKSINSAEMNEMDVDYNSVLKNGIPKRLLKPLNSESEDLIKPNDDNNNMNTGNVTLYLKEIDGSGFVIGINQYTDEPPDKESMQMFSGLENLIKTYHQSYDQTGVISDESKENTDYIGNNNHKEDAIRYKRSVRNIKLISSLKPKTKINKYLNTKAMQTRKIFLKNKRNKRHVDKIRIVASDHYPRHSKEDIFVLSHENIFADRAMVKEEDTQEVQIAERDEGHFDYVGPYENPYSMNAPHLHSYIANVYDTKSLQTGLMSHYPHIFVEDVSKSKEEFINITPSNREVADMIKTQKFRKSFSENLTDELNDEKLSEKNTSLPNVEDIVNAILPSRANYKLTVKILPKNKTDDGPGYKEVHTLINKSYDKNGLRYVSTVNVSEISKYESLNKIKIENSSKEVNDNDEVKKQRNQMKLLLNLHKVGIDLQLEHLKRESQKLRQMIEKENKDNVFKNMSNIIDIFKYLAIKELDGKINDDKITLSNSTPINNVTSAIKAKNNILVPQVPQAVPVEGTAMEVPYKTELLNTIKQNENITREILQKIDKNTDILQTFLQKLSEKLQPSHVETKTEKILVKDRTKLPAATQFIEELHRNFSNAPIPFIYAFQPPLPQNKNNKFKDVANIVYHGHIHTKGTDNHDKGGDFVKNLKHNIQDGANETKFFIDDLENDYKLATNINHHPLMLVKNSTTI